MINIAEFKVIFPEYADSAKYPDALIQYQAEVAQCYLGDVNMTDCRAHEVMLFIAHLLAVRLLVRSGKTSSIVTSSTRGEVTVSIATPPTHDTFVYWLSSTNYGLEFLSLIKLRSVGGMYIGGSPELSAFNELRPWGN